MNEDRRADSEESMASKEQNPRAQSQELWLLQFLHPQSEIQMFSPASFCLDTNMKSLVPALPTYSWAETAN